MKSERELEMFFEIVKNRNSWWGEFLKGKKRLYRKDAPVVKGTSVRRRKILTNSNDTGRCFYQFRGNFLGSSTTTRYVASFTSTKRGAASLMVYVH